MVFRIIRSTRVRIILLLALSRIGLVRLVRGGERGLGRILQGWLFGQEIWLIGSRKWVAPDEQGLSLLDLVQITL